MFQGKTALEQIVHRLGALAGEGRPVAILWDMDGTLVDTRPRMLAAVHTYGRTEVRLTDVSPSWQETAERLGLDPKRFKEVWQRVFWAYESFEADIENEEVAELARLAESLGVQTVIVTGRIEELRPVTERQLKRLGLKPSRVFLKSEIGDCTPSVKAEVISRLGREGLQMGAFVTDSVEEISAVTPDILVDAPNLACIFVQLEGTQAELDGSVHRFNVPFRNGPRMVETADRLKVADGWLEFGFEAEYEIERADKLLQLYDPLPEAEVSQVEWQTWSADQRAAWVRSLFPEPHSEEFDLPLVRNEKKPELDFLPSGIFVDSDGNIEIVSPPTHDLPLMWEQLERLEHALGPALLQVTISVPAQNVWRSPAALDGYLSFYHFLDIFERMSTGHALYQEDPDRDVLLPFMHPWLGPMTAGKQRFLRQYLQANQRGERLDEKWVRLVDRAFSSFKYITGSAYRPALAGPDRIAIEIRDAHRNKALLAHRVARHVVCLLSGLEPYTPFSETCAFDSETDYQRLSPEIRAMLETVIPSQERPEIDFMYSQYDRVALQVYRNFAKPLKDYSDVEKALGDKGGCSRLVDAQKRYRNALTALVDQYEALGTEETRRRLQGTLAAFAVESGLAERLQRFSRDCLSAEQARCAASRVHSFLPSTCSIPRTARSGLLENRLRQLAKRWPNNVHLGSVNACGRFGHSTERSLVLLSVDGLSPEMQQRLKSDYLDAVATRTLGVRTTDRGSLELRYGAEVYSPGTNIPEEYRPFSVGAGPEILLRLSTLEAYCVGRHLAAHQPCREAARRVSASGWLRHLSVGLEGQTLEELLKLPYPESIETASQVSDRILGCSSLTRLPYLVEWTNQPLATWRESHQRAYGLTLVSRPSTLVSGFPESLVGHRPLQDRLEELVKRWPRNARLVPEVPFVFGKGSKNRQVLVLALTGLSEPEFDDFRLDYLDTIGADTISFPCRLRAEHLRARLGTLALALSAEGVRVDFYEPPWERRRMEAVIELEAEEVGRLRKYVGAVIDDTLGMLGPITLGAGCRKSAGKPDNNRPTDGGKHNCTTWITLAPAGEDGTDLATLVQMPDSWMSHDNPGWWSMFLTGASRSARAQTVIYWTDLPLEQEPCAAGVPIEWDFNPH